MKTNFRELNHPAEACPTKKRGINIVDSKENYTYKKSVAILNVLQEALTQKKVMDYDWYSQKIKDAFNDVEFPTSKTKNGFIIESAMLIMRYHRFIDSLKINPIFDLPSMNILVKGTDVEVANVKPTYVYVEGNVIHVVKVSASKPTMSKISAYRRKDIYLLGQYGRLFIPNGKTAVVNVEIHHLRAKEDTTQHMVAEYNDNSIIEARAEYGSLRPREVCKNKKQCEKSGSFVAEDCPYFNNEEGCYCDRIDLQQNWDKELTVRLGEIDECTEDDCRTCSFNSVCNYKKAPLYIPSTPKTKSFSDLNLSEDQEAAIGFRKGILKINAGAGAGKTVVVAARVACMLNEGIAPEEILLITFTNTGCKEMKERIALYCSDFGLEEDLVDRLMVTTFNSFGQTIIDSEWGNLGYSKKPVLIDDVERYGILEKLLDLNDIHGIDYRNFNSMKSKNSGKGALEITKTVFEIIKNYNLSACDESYNFVIDKLGNDYNFITGGTLTIKELFALYDEYYKILKDKCFIEFADQENLVFEVIRQNPYFFDDLGLKHITIDEFQDTSEKQMNIVKEFIDTKCFESLMVVGDDSQAIFSFRDTTPEFIIHFFEHLGMDGEEIYLSDNHRSTPEIIGLANQINDLNTEKVIKNLNATRPNGVKPVVKGFWDKKDEYEWIVDSIKEKIENGTNPEDIAFIATNKDELAEMASLLAEEGVPTILLNPEGYLGNSRVQAALALARWLQEPTATKQAFIYANCLIGGDMLEKSDDEINDYIENLPQAEKFKYLKGEKKREYFHELLEELDEDDEIYQAFVETLKGKASLKDELNYCALFEEYGFKEAKRRLRQYSGVVLTTAHSSKGLEWPIVYNSISKYYSANIDKAKSNLKAKIIEEKRRLLFVSVTRARDELYVTGKYVSYGSAKEGYHYNIFLKECCNITGAEYNPKAPTKAEKEAKRIAREEKMAAKKAMKKTS